MQRATIQARWCQRKWHWDGRLEVATSINLSRTQPAQRNSHRCPFKK
nr:MAG TPA: hypothetical protein [Caudoviricetes sp.]